jgi:predicted nucleotide-binding protein
MSQEDVKIRIFIGSSSEYVEIMHKIADNLTKENNFMVKSWDNSDIFWPGDETLDAIRRQVYLSDFAILVVSPDDEIIKRSQYGSVPRDNVIFELGLFMGMLGPNRSFCLSVTIKTKNTENEVFIPSDLKGVTRIPITIEKNKYKKNDREIVNACNTITKAIKNEIDIAKDRITLSPRLSTSLAVGYFNNFIFPVGNTLENKKPNIKVQDLPSPLDLSQGNYEFKIMLPDNALDISQEGTSSFVNKFHLKTAEIIETKPTRHFPFYIQSLQTQNNNTILYDFPTTLNAAIYTVKTISENMRLNSNEAKEMRDREMDNFKSILKTLLDTSGAPYFREKFKIEQYKS